ncbi:MAG: phosphatidylserine decarboxylase family protein [Verrucomicrobia bacterium]|nr:phosphatidylserine decarboxylase family protein [Verrucomicrobiota bacterium]
MKHAGKARKAALKILLLSLAAVLTLLLVAWLARTTAALVPALTATLAVLWVLFAAFTINFFRDPEARVPSGKGLVVSPAHGTVDVVDETTENEFMGGRCKRISIFLSVLDVHVQNAPVSGKLVFHKHQDGQYLSATRTDCGTFNENVLLGIVPADFPQQKIGIRLIAGLIARRIVVWAAAGEEVAQGERISLVQFGSRGDVYLPLDAKLECKLGDKVVGGETVIATLA